MSAVPPTALRPRGAHHPALRPAGHAAGDPVGEAAVRTSAEISPLVAASGRDEPRTLPLLQADPDLARHLVDGEAASAAHAVTVPVVTVPAGPVDAALVLGIGDRAFGARVVTGLLMREVSAGSQPTLRLLGPGDILHGREVEAGTLHVKQSLIAATPSALAVLDDRLLVAVRRWPRLLTALMERTLEQHDATLVQLAISQQPRVEDRLLKLFALLADRWGAVTADGIVVPLRLTHEALGRLVGARRPTITLALRALASDDRLRRDGEGRWLLATTPRGRDGAAALSSCHVVPLGGRRALA